MTTRGLLAVSSRRPLLTLTSTPWTCWAGSQVYRLRALKPLVRPVQEDFSWSVAESAAVRGREVTAVLRGPGASRPPLGSVEGAGCKVSLGRFVMGPARTQEQGWFLSASWAPGPHGLKGSPPLGSHTELQTGKGLVGASFLPATSSHPQAQEAARLQAVAPPSRKPWCPGCCHLHAHVRFIQEPGILPGGLWRTLASQCGVGAGSCRSPLPVPGPGSGMGAKRRRPRPRAEVLGARLPELGSQASASLAGWPSS